MSIFDTHSHLTREDCHTRAWKNFELDLRLRLQVLREQNDVGDADETAKRRGRIAELKELIAFGQSVGAGRVEPGR